MTYFTNVATWDDDKREALLEWMKGEGLDPNQVRDDGRFSVHKGRVSGSVFILGEQGRIVNKRSVRFLAIPFNQKQKNPLPEALL